MSVNSDYCDEIKRKLRKLKKLEIKMRFSNISYADRRQGSFIKTKNAELVWDEFFDLHNEQSGMARYLSKSS